MSDRSQLKAQATEAPSPTISDVVTLAEFSSTPKEALCPVSAVQSEDEEDALSVPTLSTWGPGSYGKGKLVDYKSVKESLYFRETPVYWCSGWWGQAMNKTYRDT